MRHQRIGEQRRAGQGVGQKERAVGRLCNATVEGLKNSHAAGGRLALRKRFRLERQTAAMGNGMLLGHSHGTRPTKSKRTLETQACTYAYVTAAM